MLNNKRKCVIHEIIQVISIFCLHRALYKIHTCTLFSHGKIKSGRKFLVKRKKKKMKKQAPSPKPKAELSISERPIREAKNPSAK